MQPLLNWIYKILYTWIIFSAIFFGNNLSAHPVAWKKAKIGEAVVSTHITELKLYYSRTNKHAFGIHYIDFKSLSELMMLQNNVLLKRWNAPGAQANVYLKSGLGRVLVDNEKGVAHIGGQADWESRRVYTMMSIDSYFGGFERSLWRARVGWAPYDTDFERLSSWVMLQLESNQGAVAMMPMLRFFKANYLVEFGTDFSENSMVTAMVHW